MFSFLRGGTCRGSRSTTLHSFSLLAVAVSVGNLECCSQQCLTEPPPLSDGDIAVFAAPVEESPSVEASATDYAIGSVVIVPATVHAEAGSKFKLQARALTPAGKWITTPFPGASWSATDPTSGSPNHFLQFEPGTPTTVTVGDPWPLEAMVLTPPRSPPIEVTATIDGVTSKPATVFISRPLLNPSPDFDQIRMPEATGRFPDAVILDAKIVGGAYQQDLLHAVVGRAYLEENLKDGNDPAYPQVAALFEEYAGLYQGPTDLPAKAVDAPLLWTPNKGDQLDRQVEKTGRAPLSVHFWKGADRGVNANGNDRVLDQIAFALGEAQGNFDRSHAGIEIQEHPVLRAGSSTNETFLDRYCDPLPERETELKAFLRTGLDPGETLDFAPGEVYVAIVDKYHRVRPDGTYDNRSAKACIWQDREYAIVVIEYGLLDPGRLPHELGHLLALNEDHLSPSHAFASQGFTCSNTMWGGFDPDCPGAQYQFSLGQVYRMSFDVGSHLFRGSWNRTSVDCQGPGMGTGVCPTIALDFPTTEF